MSREYITAHGSVTIADLTALIAEFENDGTTAYAVWTDKFACEKRFSGKDAAHLQELRIFDEGMEFRARRKGQAFQWRVIDDNKFREALCSEPDDFLKDFENRTYTERQYLDVDARLTSGTNYVTTGGGHYTMPEEGLRRIVLRNYLDYDADGILQINDFRLVGFEKEA